MISGGNRLHYRTLNHRHRPLDQRRPIWSLLPVNPAKAVIRLRSKAVGQMLLAAREKVDAEVTRVPEDAYYRGTIVDADQNQWRNQGYGREGIDCQSVRHTRRIASRCD